LPRQPRVDAPGLIHHVWTRGIEKRRIFFDDLDRGDFVARLSRVLPDSGATCLSWALLSNHIHLVIRTGDRPLSELMKRVNTGFAVRFNLRHDRSGHLFQNRFGSRRLQSDRDLLGVVRYVERNPLEAGIVDDLASLRSYPWSGLGALVEDREALPFEQPEDVRSLLGGDRLAAIASLLDLIRSEAEDPTPSSPDAPSDLAGLIARSCAACDVTPVDLLAGRRTARATAARTLICRSAIRELGISARAVATALRITPGAVSQAMSRKENKADF
jgi:REP element-mobilizing transposase RayT